MSEQQAVPLDEENLPEVPTPQVVILGDTVTRHGGDATATMERADWEAMTEAEQQAWSAATEGGTGLQSAQGADANQADDGRDWGRTQATECAARSTTDEIEDAG